MTDYKAPDSRVDIYLVKNTYAILVRKVKVMIPNSGMRFIPVTPVVTIPQHELAERVWPECKALLLESTMATPEDLAKHEVRDYSQHGYAWLMALTGHEKLSAFKRETIVTALSCNVNNYPGKQPGSVHPPSFDLSVASMRYGGGAWMYGDRGDPDYWKYHISQEAGLTEAILFSLGLNAGQ